VVKYTQQEKKTNNNIYSASSTGRIQTINSLEKDVEITILGTNGVEKIQKIPKEVSLIVKQGQVVQQDQALTVNPNVGGFGQTEVEIVLQSPARIYGFIAFCFSVIISQTMFVLKKKQFEKVQLAELDF